MPPQIFILFGAPGSGKSTILNYLNNHQDKFNTVIFAKETTRPSRKGGEIEVKCVNTLSPDCDIRYTQYGIEYGANSQLIWETFKTGRNIAIIINDIRTIKLIKQKFGVLAKSIYIHSTSDREEKELLARERTLNPDGEVSSATLKRIKKITTIHRKYIENTSLFDHAILNTGTYENLYSQVEPIFMNQKARGEPSASHLKIFIIVGATDSGKDDLVLAMEQMEQDRVVNYTKSTNRPKRNSDRGELNHIKNFDNSLDIQYSKNTYKYGISTNELWTLLSSNKIVLLVLSDETSINNIINIFGEICTILYLHADFDRETIQQKMKDEGLSDNEIEKRLNDIDNLYEYYCRTSMLFDHVLLNTAELEDLYDQSFNVLDYYC